MSEPERQIRSYHKAFQGDLTIYSFGKDLKPWRPIPARGIFWVGGLAVLMFVALHILQIHPPLFSISWAFFYLGIPISLGWLMTVAKVEGRRIHVAAGAWIWYAFGGREFVGGYRRLATPASPRQGRIRVAPTYELTHRSRVRYVIGVLPILVLGIVLLIIIGNHAPRHTPTVVPAAVSVPTPTVTVVPTPTVTERMTYPPKRPAVSPWHHASRHHSVSIRHVVPARPFTPRPSAPVTQTTVSAPPPPQMSPPVPHVSVVHTAPRVAVSPSTSPRPSCYPGTLGC